MRNLTNVQLYALLTELGACDASLIFVKRHPVDLKALVPLIENTIWIWWFLIRVAPQHGDAVRDEWLRLGELVNQGLTAHRDAYLRGLISLDQQMQLNMDTYADRDQKWRTFIIALIED